MTPSRRFGGLHPQVVDTALAVLIFLCVLLASRWGHSVGGKSTDLTGVVFIALGDLPLAFRRRAPRTALLVCAVGSVALAASGYWQPLSNFGVLIALYTVAAMRSRRAGVYATLFSTAVLSFGTIGTSGGPPWLMVLLAFAFTGTSWALGDVARLLAERNSQLAALTQQLALDREARARQAVNEERIHIARELHDVLAHHIAVISVQAGLARYVVGRDVATTTGALDVIASTSREVLDEMRRMLTVLRVDATPVTDADLDPDDAGDRVLAELRNVGQRAPAPGLDRIDDLVNRVRTAGVPVELTISGVVCPVPSGVGLCAYRIVQESLTNVLKHADKAQVAVLLHYGSTELVVEVVDDGAGVTVEAVSAGGGHGLIGMVERTKLYDGTFSATAQPHGGFRVRLVLPIGSNSQSSRGNEVRRGVVE